MRLQITYPSTFGVFEDGVQDVSIFATRRYRRLFVVRLVKSYTNVAVKSTLMVCTTNCPEHLRN